MLCVLGLIQLRINQSLRPLGILLNDPHRASGLTAIVI